MLKHKSIFRFYSFLCFFVLLKSISINAQQKDPLLTSDFANQQKWVQEQMEKLTLEEKIGQLFMVQAYSNKDEAHAKSLEAEIKKHHIGGLIFMQGTPDKQAVLNNRLQSQSKIPLLIGFDGEWGLDMRLKNTFRYPWNMTLGAIQNDQLISQFGQRLGVHCKRLGIHINFAPVVDVNTNPENPIIGNRSFGEDKLNVTLKATAFIEGMQSENVLANAKHFPGHGDTSSDSHKTLPQLLFDMDRLNDIELYPYEQIFKTGLASVMVAHLSVPALEPDAAVPTSISKKVITELLQQKMGFKGLIFTDALNMKGAANYAKPGDIDLAAFMAGNDMLLIPENVGAAVKKIKDAIDSKKITIERLNFSVEKILKAKYWAGLNAYKPVVLEDLEKDLNTITDSVLHRKLVEHSMTLLQNKKNIFPITDLKKNKIAYVKIGDASNDKFLAMLRNYAEVTEVVSDEISMNDQLEVYDRVIVGYHKSNDNPWKSFKFSSDELNLLKTISSKNRTILTVFASPYSLLDVPSFDAIEGVFMAYQNSDFSQEVAAQMIFGALETKGKLPVTIGTVFEKEFGLNSTNLMSLAYDFPESVGMSSEKLKKIDSLLKQTVLEKMAPGGQVLIARHGKVVYRKSFGYHTYDSLLPVKNTDIYDLASVTKIIGALPMIMKAEEQDYFQLDSKLGSVLSEFRRSNKKDITIKSLLSHTGRLKPWIPFYLETLDKETKLPMESLYSNEKSKTFSIEVAKNLYLKTDYEDVMFKEIRDSDLLPNEGYKYSDLPFHIFKRILENKYRKGLDELVENYFYKSMGATSMTYNPYKKFGLNQLVPSEDDTYYRHQRVQGYVHDMGAAMMGGVSGNAGLFANANDVAKIMQMYLQKGYYGGHRYLQIETLDKFNKQYYANEGIRRGLGFDKPELDGGHNATCGCVSNQSFGHSGFTGTYTWADPETGLVYVFLSNRTFPSMENNKLAQKDIRTKIQAIAVEAIVE